MALELLTLYSTDIVGLGLVPSEGGRFEVTVNDTLIFSKLKEGRFPDPKELRTLIEQGS